MKPGSSPGRGSLARAATCGIVAVFLGACAGAPPAREPAELPAYGGKPAAAPARPPKEPAAAPATASPARFVRVLVEESREPVTFEADTIRLWDAAGRQAGGQYRSLEVSARGGSVHWGRSSASSVDLAGVPDVRWGGKRYSGRLRVAARDGRLRVIAVAPFEDYVAAVLSKEAPRSFQPEALKAIAVAVRTYAALALARPRDRDYDLGATVEDQVFDAGASPAESIAAAAGATRGEIIMYDGAPAQANFHSTCGGRTESAVEAWGGQDLPYLRPVSCPDCRESPAWRWDCRMDAKEAKRVCRALGVAGGGDLSIEVMSRTSTGRASRIRLSGGGVSRETQAALFRKTAGYARVRSLKFEIRRVGDSWMILGEGYGHGVGLCQWGANGMAKAGSGYREILARYYPKTSVSGGGS